MPPPQSPHDLGARLLAEPARRAWLAAAAGGEPTRVDTAARLWRGYGAILRLHVEGGHAPSVIVKWVAPPGGPARTDDAAAHARKLHSYEVEQRFYSARRGAPAPARIADCHATARGEDGLLTVLEDLDASGFDGRRERPDDDELLSCLRWLAAFHAHFLGRAPDGLWAEGTYWQLATRRRERAAMRDAELRDAAGALHAALRAASHRTFVHGDAKPENFCFAPAGVAAVDFQYVGGGVGVRDVAYLLSCSRTDDECERTAADHLDDYFRALRAELAVRRPDVDADALEQEWRALYPAAWADLWRFLDGWAPGRWPIHRYTRHMLRLALGRA